jgi:HD-GYP domain-containing protein (c-di-GMP phosphodiesterase class II)
MVNRLIGRLIRFDRTQVRRALGDFVVTWQNGNQTLSQLYPLFRELGFDRYETLQHARRVMEYAVLLGEACQISATDIRRLRLGALLHDIGKVAIPGRILSKPEPLTDEEADIVRKHPSVGWGLLAGLPDLTIEADIVYSHHERFDGAGYPRRLRGNEIVLPARIVSVVDSFDALTNPRPHRPAFSVEEARQSVLRGSGTQFDPEITRHFHELPIESLTWIRELFPERNDLEDLGDTVMAGRSHTV